MLYGWENARCAEGAPVAPHPAAIVVSAALRDTPTRVRIASAAWAAGVRDPRGVALDAWLRTSLKRGDLILLCVAQPTIVARLADGPEPEEVLGPEEEGPATMREVVDWIEIRLVDATDGTPLPNVRYRIVDSAGNGCPYEGVLDAYGRARVEGVVPGTCIVSFPDLDERSVSP